MKKLTITVLQELEKENIPYSDLQILLQDIAHRLDIKTTANFAKLNNLSYNGVKNHRPHILIDGIKFHSLGIKEDSLPF